jgi:hypothetical protein
MAGEIQKARKRGDRFQIEGLRVVVGLALDYP